MTTFSTYRLRGAEPTSAFAIAENPMVQRLTTREINEMLMYEDLARARMREAEQDAARRRLAHQMLSVRRWRRLASWANRHVRDAEARVRQG